MNLGLLEAGEVIVGDWVVIHMGFVLEKISAEAVADAMDALEAVGPWAAALGTDLSAPPQVSRW